MKAVRDQLALIERLCERSTYLTAEVEQAVEQEADVDSHLIPDRDGDELGRAARMDPLRPECLPEKARSED
ncbi:MAG: hypothetical protein JWO38_2582 [Gemmataceae bacterium]|nr:hypothetical protein [Gemmataceae bacterium]